jgi:hypothetical protein
MLGCEVVRSERLSVGVLIDIYRVLPCVFAEPIPKTFGLRSESD